VFLGSTTNRAAIFQFRKGIGDIEVDLMMGNNHKGALLVMTDRATLHTLTFESDKAFPEHQPIGLTRNQALQKIELITRTYKKIYNVSKINLCSCFINTNIMVLIRSRRIQHYFGYS
jgi:IS30 family transposase